VRIGTACGTTMPVEITGGRVRVLDLPPYKAKEVADLVATTDGIIYSFQFDGKLPNGKIAMAQAVGHFGMDLLASGPADGGKGRNRRVVRRRK
jgi:hypothetical protein